MKPLTEHSTRLLHHSFGGLGLLKPLHGTVKEETSITYSAEKQNRIPSCGLSPYTKMRNR